MEYDRFAIRKDEPFSLLKTVEFDVQLAAPVEMRVIQMNFQIEYYEKIFEEEWLYRIEVLDDIKMEDREGWLTP